jgi:hypothetical protein
MVKSTLVTRTNSVRSRAAGPKRAISVTVAHQTSTLRASVRLRHSVPIFITQCLRSSMVELFICNEGVVSSNLTAGSNFLITSDAVGDVIYDGADRTHCSCDCRGYCSQSSIKRQCRIVEQICAYQTSPRSYQITILAGKRQNERTDKLAHVRAGTMHATHVTLRISRRHVES